MRALVTRVADRIESRDAPRFARLRRAAVHNDPNDYNILVSDLPPEGGSSALKAEPLQAVELPQAEDRRASSTSATSSTSTRSRISRSPSPTPCSARTIRWRRPCRSSAATRRSGRWTTTRSESLFRLVLLRLCTSVCIAARQQKQRPGDAYLSVSQGPIAQTLPALAALDPAAVEQALRHPRGRSRRRDAGGPQARRRPESVGRVPAAGEGRPRMDAVPLRPRRAALPRRVQQRAARRAQPSARRAGGDRADAAAQHEHALPARQRCRRSRSGSRRRCRIR